MHNEVNYNVIILKSKEKGKDTVVSSSQLLGGEETQLKVKRKTYALLPSFMG